MSTEKKEMVPVTRDYTINLHKACHKVYVIVPWHDWFSIIIELLDVCETNSV